MGSRRRGPLLQQCRSPCGPGPSPAGAPWPTLGKLSQLQCCFHTTETLQPSVVKPALLKIALRFLWSACLALVATYFRPRFV